MAHEAFRTENITVQVSVRADAPPHILPNVVQETKDLIRRVLAERLGDDFDGLIEVTVLDD